MANFDSLTTEELFKRVNISFRVRELRKLSGISADTLEVSCGINDNRMRVIDAGIKIPSLRELLLISLALGCKISDLIRE
jgi:hypothetical protein